MTIINVNEENHGHIVLALCYRSAIDFLTYYNWLTADTEISFWSDKINDFDLMTVSHALGENWEEQIYNLTIDEFNDMFEGSFWLCPERVYE